MKALVNRWLSYQEFLRENPRGRGWEPPGTVGRRGVEYEDPAEKPLIGTILWWPYFSKRVHHRGNEPGCQELEIFDWNIQYSPGSGWVENSPRGGWQSWIDLMGSQMMLPKRLSELEEIMKYELETLWSRDPIPPHRIPRGRLNGRRETITLQSEISL